MKTQNGIICFTFDDRNFEGWLSAVPIFEKYGAHASFFISGNMDDEALSAARMLYSKGHTIGLHTVNHADAPEYFEKYGAESYFENEIAPQLKALTSAGIQVKSFGYPNNRRTDETDEFLSKTFSRFRAGNRLSDEKYFSAELVNEKRVMRGFGIGEFYGTTTDDIMGKLAMVSSQNLCMTFFSHNISKDAVHIHMPLDLLETSLAKARELGIRVVGFDEL